MQTFNIDMSSLRQLSEKLAGLSMRDEADALREGLRKSLVPVKDAAKANILAIENQPRPKSNGFPLPLGNLRQSINVKAVTYQNGALHTGMVGPSREKFAYRVKIQSQDFDMSKLNTRKWKRDYAVPARYAHLVEFGSYNELTKRRNRPKPFLRPAFDSEKSRVQTEIVGLVSDAIQRQFDKLK